MRVRTTGFLRLCQPAFRLVLLFVEQPDQHNDALPMEDILLIIFKKHYSIFYRLLTAYFGFISRIYNPPRTDRKGNVISCAICGSFNGFFQPPLFYPASPSLPTISILLADVF